MLLLIARALRRFCLLLADTIYKLHCCEACGLVGEGFKKCAQCMRIYFCSAVCQHRHWPVHRLTCLLENKSATGKSVKSPAHVGDTDASSSMNGEGNDDEDIGTQLVATAAALAKKLGMADPVENPRYRHKQHRRRKKTGK